MTVKRITFLQELLTFMGLDGRVHLAWISSAEAQKFVQVVTDFTEKIRSLGPNPIAGANAADALRPLLSRPLENRPQTHDTQPGQPDRADMAKEETDESKSETVA